MGRFDEMVEAVRAATIFAQDGSQYRRYRNARLRRRSPTRRSPEANQADLARLMSDFPQESGRGREFMN